MYCNNCGAQVPDGSKYCNSCGAEIGVVLHKTVESQPTNDIPIISKQPKKEKIQWGYVLISILVLIVLLVGCLVFLNPAIKNLYYFSAFNMIGDDSSIPQKEMETFKSAFTDKYLFKNDKDEYYIVDIISGLGGSEKDIKEFAEENDLDYSFVVSGSYAYIRIEDNEFDIRIFITFSKATFEQKIEFAKRYFF